MRLTRGDVIARAATVFQRRGFHATSMADLAAACGILKGSLYHHFPSKDDLALAVLDDIHSRFRADIFARAYGPGTPEDRMIALTDAVAAYFLARDGACLMGSFALELGASDERFAARLRAWFDDWATAIAAPLAPRHGAIEAQRLGRDFVARSQGALMLMKVSGDDEALTRCHAAMIAAASNPASAGR